MADVTLSAAVRNSLLSLQGTTDLINRTQGRLSTGLRVAGPIDDPVAYFSAKSLDDRTFDFTEKKDAIDQGISTLSAALDGVNAIESLVRQLKGVGNSMKSASVAQFADLISQYNDLRTQVDNLATDASYQGTNLINGTGEALTVEFSNLTAARLAIDSVDLTVGTNGLSVGSAVAFTTGNVYVSYAANTGTSFGTTGIAAGITQTGALSLTWEGGNVTYSAGASITMTYGTAQSVSIITNTGVTLNAGDTISAQVDSAAAATGFSIVANDQVGVGVSYTASTWSAQADSGDTGIAVTWQGGDAQVSTANTYSFTYSGGTKTINFGTGANATYGTLTAGEVINVRLSLTTVGPAHAGAYVTAAVIGQTASNVGAAAGTAVAGLQFGAGSVTAATIAANYLSSGDSTAVAAAITELDTALTTLRTQASTLGSNVALLQTRLNFTESYVNTLSEGSSKLTLADLNAEGANLLALQTRQQLGIQALAFAGQAEQAILRLFG